MGKYLKTYKRYPAGSLIITKKYSLWRRFVNFIKCKRREYNSIYILPIEAGLSLSKVELLINDYYIFIPKKPYTKKEIKQLQILIANCETTEDYMAALNIIRPGTLDTSKSLDQLKNNTEYIKIYLDSEPFQEFNKHDK